MTYDNIFRLNGKVALCVGVGGIGESVAFGLRDFGANVIVGDIDNARAKKVAYNLYEENSYKFDNIDPFWAQIDITNSNSIKEALNSVFEFHKKLDIVVNMVGYNIFKNSLEMSESEFKQVLAINLLGAWNLSKAAAKIMDQQGTGGKIINAASITAFFGSPGQGAYAAAKAGLVNMTKTLALEWIDKGIYVNAISPVMTETPINTDWLSEVPERRQNIAKKIPIGRLGRPEDFIGPVVFLASEASNFVIGQTIPVDGGTSVQHPLIN